MPRTSKSENLNATVSRNEAVSSGSRSAEIQQLREVVAVADRAEGVGACQIGSTAFAWRLGNAWKRSGWLLRDVRRQPRTSNVELERLADRYRDLLDQSVLADYSKCLVAQGGQPYDPNDPDTDTGLDPAGAAKWRQTVGITDADGGVHKVGPSRSINVDRANGDVGLVICSGYVAGMCWNLPGSADDQFEKHHIWDDLSSPPEGGHYTENWLNRNSKGNLIFYYVGSGAGCDGRLCRAEICRAHLLSQRGIFTCDRKIARGH